MKAAQVFTVQNKVTLYKGEQEANSIELIELEEVGFMVVAQKNLYQIGDKVVLVQPDYNVSDIPLFESYIRPNGDESKSMLGKVNGLPRRIRAKKFNLSKEPNGTPVYSNGILLPISEVEDYLESKGINFYIGKGFGEIKLSLEDLDLDLTESLGITKYEEPEYTSKGGVKVAGGIKFPDGVYRTDEENINNLWKELTYPITLVGTEKCDGSSISIGITPQIPEGFICSRNMRKKLTIKKVVGRKKETLWVKILSWFGYGTDLNIYEEVESDDDFVKHGKPLLDHLINSGESNIILRGELNGGNLKGSGNKNNPASKEPVNIKIFGIDRMVDNLAVKVSYEEFIDTTKRLGLTTVKEVFNQTFNSKEELVSVCEDYFKDNMIEGIVVRSLDSIFSAKFMNLKYDSLK